MLVPETQGNDIFCVTCGEPWGIPSKVGRSIETGRETCPSCEGKHGDLLNALRALVFASRSFAVHSPYPELSAPFLSEVAQAESVIQAEVWKIQGLRSINLE